jgi:hypothetical protein
LEIERERDREKLMKRTKKEHICTVISSLKKSKDNTFRLKKLANYAGKQVNSKE